MGYQDLSSKNTCRTGTFRFSPREYISQVNAQWTLETNIAPQQTGEIGKIRKTHFRVAESSRHDLEFRKNAPPKVGTNVQFSGDVPLTAHSEYASANVTARCGRWLPGNHFTA